MPGKILLATAIKKSWRYFNLAHIHTYRLTCNHTAQTHDHTTHVEYIKVWSDRFQKVTKVLFAHLSYNTQNKSRMFNYYHKTR